MTEHVDPHVLCETHGCRMHDKPAGECAGGCCRFAALDALAARDAELARLRESVESGARMHAATIEQFAEVMAERDGLREQLSRMALDALAADTQAFEAYEKQIVAEAELARVMALEQNERTPHMDEAARLRKGLERIRDSTFRSAVVLRAAADSILNGGTP